MNRKTNTVRAILLDASECDRPEADHPATIEICADDLQRILERHITEPAQCLLQIAEPATAGTAVRVFRDYLGVHDGIKLGGHAMDDMALDLARIALNFPEALKGVRSEKPEPAPPQAVQPVVPLPLLVRDIARDLGITVPEACIALKPLGYYSTNSAVTAEMATKLREAFPNPAPQAVQAALPLPTVELIGVKDGKETNLGLVPMPPTMRARELLRDVGFTGLDDDDGEGAYAMGACEQLIEYCQAYYAAPAHPAEGVPAQASEWDGKLPERLQGALNALRLECPPAVAAGMEFEVRSHYEAMHTSLSTSRRMYSAARDRLEAIDAAQPNPFAATQPAAGAVASIYVTAGGEREFDDWKVPLSVGRNLLYTQPAAQGMDAKNCIPWVPVQERVPAWTEDDSVRVLALTADDDFGGEQVHDIKASDFYLDGGDGVIGTEITEVCTHWVYRDDVWPHLAAQAKQGGAA